MRAAWPLVIRLTGDSRAQESADGRGGFPGFSPRPTKRQASVQSLPVKTA